MTASSRSSMFTVPDDYHYVMAALSLIAPICWWQVVTVIKWRRLAKVTYPQMYADQAQVEANKDAHIFNCAQRAHQNTLEGLPLIVLSTVITGLEYPRIAAGVCTLWAYSRIPYTMGYLTGNPAKRTQYGAVPGFGSNMLLAIVAFFVAGKRLYEARFSA